MAIVTVGYMRGEDKTVTGSVTMHVTVESVGDATVEVTGVNVADFDTISVRSDALLLPDYPADGSATATADYPALDSGYTYGIDRTENVVLTNTRSHTGQGNWADEVGPDDGSISQGNNTGTIHDIYSTTPRVSVGLWHDDSSGSVPGGSAGQVDGTATVTGPDSVDVVTGLHTFTPNGWDTAGVGTRTGICYRMAPFPPRAGSSFPLGTDTYGTWGGFQTRPFDGTWKLDFTLTLYNWVNVEAEEGSPWPPGGGTSDPTAIAPSLAIDVTGLALRARAVGTDVYAERRTIDSGAWTAIANWAGKHPVAYWWYGDEHVVYVNGTDSIRDRDVRARTEVTLVTGKHPCVAINAGGSIKALAYLVGTAYKCTVYGGAGNAIGSEATILASGAPNAPGSLAWTLPGVLEFEYSDGTNLHTLTSTDLGQTWA
jgi:hypothetical protein